MSEKTEDAEGKAVESEDQACSSSSKPNEKEPSVDLEEHRCAICQNILINACRIDCGHTFCRHCLNVDRENRISLGKPTCFICDAAITEISANSEKDQEIDSLFRTLSIDQRLSRVRAKAERKLEEDSFSEEKKKGKSRSDNTQNQNSDESIGSGDASYNRLDNCDVEAPWIGTGSNPLEDEEDDSTLYCRPYTCIWSEEDQSGMEDGYNLLRPCHEEQDEDGSPSDYTALELGGSQFPSHPFSHPIVIHHTVQHIYHTVSVDENNRRSNRRRHRRNHIRPDSSSDFAHENPLQNDRGASYCIHNYYHPPSPTYSYGQCHSGFYPPRSALPTYSCATQSAYYHGCASGGYPPSVAYANSHYPQQQYDVHPTDSEGDEERQSCCSRGGCHACENLCEYHRAMHDRDETVSYAVVSSSHENLEQREEEQDIRGLYDDQSEQSDSNVVTFSMSIPITLEGSISQLRDSGERPLTPCSEYRNTEDIDG